MFVQNDNTNLAATSLTASIANAAALVEHELRQLRTALVYLWARESTRRSVRRVAGRGIARRWNRGGFRETANPAKSRSVEPWPRDIFADGGMPARSSSKHLPEGEWKRHRATRGFALVAPMDR
jgi:hypothetical protein